MAGNTGIGAADRGQSSLVLSPALNVLSGHVVSRSQLAHKVATIDAAASSFT
jgi:hypothetical protein